MRVLPVQPFLLGVEIEEGMMVCYELFLGLGYGSHHACCSSMCYIVATIQP